MEEVDKLLAWNIYWQIAQIDDSVSDEEAESTLLPDIINDCVLLLIPPVHINISDMIQNINVHEASLYEVIWELLLEKSTSVHMLNLCSDIVNTINTPSNSDYICDTIKYIYNKLSSQYKSKHITETVPNSLIIYAEKLFYIGNLLMYVIQNCNNYLWDDILLSAIPCDSSQDMQLLHVIERTQSSMVKQALTKPIVPKNATPVNPLVDNVDRDNIMLMRDQDIVTAIELAQGMHKSNPNHGIQVTLNSRSSKANLELITKHKKRQSKKFKKKKHKKKKDKVRLSWMKPKDSDITVETSPEQALDLEVKELEILLDKDIKAVENSDTSFSRAKLTPNNIIDAYLYIESTVTTFWKYIIKHGRYRCNINNYLKNIHTTPKIEYKYIEIRDASEEILKETNNYDIIYNSHLLQLYIRLMDNICEKITEVDKDADRLLREKYGKLSAEGYSDYILVKKLSILKFLIAGVKEHIRDLEEKSFNDFGDKTYEDNITELRPIVDNFKLGFNKLLKEFRTNNVEVTPVDMEDHNLDNLIQELSDEHNFSNDTFNEVSSLKDLLVNPVTGEIALNFTSAASSSNED